MNTKKALVLIGTSFLLICSVQACRAYREGIPPANRPNSIRDSWYFSRDTLNFYQVDLSVPVVSVIDSVVGSVTPDENKYWLLEINSDSRALEEFCLSIIYVEKVLHYNAQSEERIFKAHLHQGKPILIIDDRNTVPVNLEKPLVKIYNPRVMDDDWLFRLDGKRACFELKDQVWLRQNRF